MTATSETGFTATEMARAHEIRAFSERPENLGPHDPHAPRPECYGTFAGVVVGYRLLRVRENLWRQCTMTIPGGRADVPTRIATEIAARLFGFAPRVPIRFGRDPSGEAKCVSLLQAVGDVRACRVCGCTDLRACLGGCSWVAADVCSACRRAS